MQLLIPFAGPPVPDLGAAAGPARADPDAATADVSSLALVLPPLPNLSALLASLDEVERDEGDEWSLSPPHERALARALGWQGGDGQRPWAARAARADGLDTADHAVGLVTPAHWHLGTHQVSLIDPASLMLSVDDSRALLDAVRELFVSEGFAVAFGAVDRWYLMHDSLAALATASLDRVIGRNVDRWLGSDPAARRIRRLQSEAQMLLAGHPLNAAREARGLLPVNSFWLSGCGLAQPECGPAPEVEARLRGPALAADLAAWCKAWESLDAGPLAALRQRVARGQPVRLTLCGERCAVTLAQGARGPWRRLAAGVSQRMKAPRPVMPWLEAL